MRKIILFILFMASISSASCQDNAGIENTIITGAEQTHEYLPLLKDKKVGMVINRSSIIGKTSLVDSMLSHGIDVGVILSPEHGYGGTGDAGEYIYDKEDVETGITIVSLYHKKRKPAAEDLNGLDMVVFDLQDVGVRFYTYISTLHYVMESCAENNIPLLVLDRPNPNGHYVDGPVLEPAYRSFLGMHRIPVVYGLTIGELACMINNEGWLKDGIRCNLRVVPCRNYTHHSFYELPVNPSPNLRSMKAVYLYPTLGLFTGTVMSMGRGTEFPFLVVGHPEFADRVFSYIPVSGTGAKNPKYNGQVCYGIDLRRYSLDSLRNMKRIDISLIQYVYSQMNKCVSFFNNSFNAHAGNGKLKEQLVQGLTPEEIRESWEPELTKYKIIRKKYLLYPDFDE
ncbi:MAG: DUF1343 domain-containing protein [Bacteroidales bacterium]|nr:DUF1343 domain-containing protein [Bacteroidales bacterium]